MPEAYLMHMLVTDPAEPFQLAFARSAAGSLAGMDGVGCEASGEGLRLRAMTEKKLLQVAGYLSARFTGLRFEPPQVVYRTEPELMEPIMLVEVTVPELSVGNVVADLSSRLGLFLDTADRGGQTRIRAEVPLTFLFGYDNTLGAMTDGEGTVEMDFVEYRPVRRPRPPDGSDPVAGRIRPGRIA